MSKTLVGPLKGSDFQYLAETVYRANHKRNPQHPHLPWAIGVLTDMQHPWVHDSNLQGTTTTTYTRALDAVFPEGVSADVCNTHSYGYIPYLPVDPHLGTAITLDNYIEEYILGSPPTPRDNS